jgi:hypothetical protein
MRPSRKENDKRLALFRERLENLLNREHELYRLAGLINLDLFEQDTTLFLLLGKTSRQHAEICDERNLVAYG